MRARQMRDGDDVMDLNVDPDETYNADEEGRCCVAALSLNKP